MRGGVPSRRRGDPFYYSTKWRLFRALTLKRDGYCCTKCGAGVRGPGRSRVDHIKPRRTHPELELVLENLRTLCPDCDNQAHREKGQKNPGQRVERFRGVDATGTPLDPEHHWNKK